MSGRLNYYRRVFAAYVLRRQSQLTFWHEDPEVEPNADKTSLGPYYMTFGSKADYPGPRDDRGIPLLDYQGTIGLQHNPIAIAQYGLGNYNLHLAHGDRRRREEFLRVADWLVDNLETNEHGLHVWNHHFDWEYRTRLVAPWYSGLAQGQGISALVRAHHLTSDDGYLEAAGRAFRSLRSGVDDGGTLFIDDDGGTWIEEYIVSPPTHILNGSMWALWGVYDLWLATGSEEARVLFDEGAKTLTANLERFDLGFWSLYELSGTRLRMIASPFYHRLHVVQLRIMEMLTEMEVFGLYARRWEGYLASRFNRTRAMAHKLAFKVIHY